MKKLAIITTHTIQYNAPLFKLLAERNRIELKVFYTWSQSRAGKLYDPGFAKVREWDIPLLEGYEYEFIDNTAKNPGSHYFWGIVNPTLIQKIKIYNPNAILVYGWSFYSHLRVITHFKGKIPVFFRGDSTLLDDTESNFFKKTIRRILLSWVYFHIDKVFYVGHANKKYFQKNGVQPNQLLYAPHAIDNKRFHDVDGSYEMEAKIWREKLMIPSTAIVFLFAGKLEPKKNPLLLLRAFKNINCPNLFLIFIGNGILEERLKNESKSNSNIKFIDFQNQQIMPVVYRLGNVFVLPSKGPGETWGLSVNEAMTCGRPAIVSDACGCYPDLIIEGKTGYLFKRNDLSDLIRCMSLFRNKQQIANMTNAIINHISNFNLQNIAVVIEDAVNAC